MTQNETLLLGIDIGTTGTKCAIYDLKGELVAHAYQEYSMIHPQPSWTEQDPHRWWNAVQTNLHNCFEQQGIDSSRIASIGLSCTNAMTLVDEAGEPVYNAIGHHDKRADPQVAWLRERVGEDLVLRVTANKLDKGSFCLPSLRWLIDNRPELVARAYKMLMPSGYIIQKLTGKFSMNRPRMSLTSLSDIRTGEWSREIAKKAEIPFSLYFNMEMAGGQIPENIKNPDPEEYIPLLEETHCIKRWDAAPELPGAMQFGKYITAKGVLASVGHTQAEFEDIQTAYEAGYTHATHFYNAMPGFHKRKEYKYEGTVESIYLIDDMTVEVVADGIHVPPTILRLVYKIKGVERTCLITDALACAASDSKTAFDPRVIIEDGVCKLADRSALAGSVATMDRLIRTMVQNAEIPLADAVRMASETPARIMGVLDRKGTLERGKDADIIALDRDLNVRAVWAMGQLVEGTNKLF